MFQHTAARRRLRSDSPLEVGLSLVSTHSRAKAAAVVCNTKSPGRTSFNTQPREGGCDFAFGCHIARHPTVWFQHTAARRRLPTYFFSSMLIRIVSTHSRAKAAATIQVFDNTKSKVSTHSRAKAAAPLNHQTIKK